MIIFALLPPNVIGNHANKLIFGPSCMRRGLFIRISDGLHFFQICCTLYMKELALSCEFVFLLTCLPDMTMYICGLLLGEIRC